MNPSMMRHWLAGQAQKAGVSPAQMQRKRLGINEGFFTVTQPQNPIAQQQAAEPTQRKNPMSAFSYSGSSIPTGRPMSSSGAPNAVISNVGAGVDYLSSAKKKFADTTRVTQYDDKWDPKTRRIVHSKRELTPAEIHAQGWDDPDKRGFTDLFKSIEAKSMERTKNFTKYLNQDIQNSMAWTREPFRLGVGKPRRAY